MAHKDPENHYEITGHQYARKVAENATLCSICLSQKATRAEDAAYKLWHALEDLAIRESIGDRDAALQILHLTKDYGKEA